VRKVLNNTQISQIVYDWKYDPIEIPPNCFFPSRNVGQFKVCDSISEYLKSAKRLLVIRRFALGDVLMLLCVLRELKAYYKLDHITLATSGMLADHPVINQLNFSADLITSTSRLDKISYDAACHLDGWLEMDHISDKFAFKHRIDLYREFFELPTGKDPDWSGFEIKVSSKYIVFCPAGRRIYNSLSLKLTKEIEKGLSRHKKVVLISDENRVEDDKLVDIIAEASVLVTVDSGPLWIAHYTATPVVFLSGPTKPEQRVSYHPLYPDGVETVRLAERVGCSSCFERAVGCNFSAACMKNDREAKAIASEVVRKVGKVRWKR